MTFCNILQISIFFLTVNVTCISVTSLVYNALLFRLSESVEVDTNIVEAANNTMDDLDAALNELGMLSNVTKYRLEYLQAS